MAALFETCGNESDTTHSSEGEDDEIIRAELPLKWIPTLSMRFRDETKREKFFVTYIRRSNNWLRVSISIDYTGCEEGSLEHDIASLPYQRDKNFYIYKAVRESLGEISWFDSVTNLRLQTIDDRLHIHVAEDANEKIPYPSLKLLDHIKLQSRGYQLVDESSIHFDAHLSGFVYRVKVNNQTYVKKEITSTDTVQEFIYEIEALVALRESTSIINLFGIVTCRIDGIQCVTGILVEWAGRGALNDFFFNLRDKELDWPVRLTWIRQVVQGLADIHEAGFIQGDCTLSNIVLDMHSHAKIVDINRRGCPIGWEPPEFRGMIESGQRISMYIGVKSDIYQMGIVLWAIATKTEEPIRASRPLELVDPSTPQELVDVIKSCLANEPSMRKSAKEVLGMLPKVGETKANLPPVITAATAFPSLEDLNSALPSLEEIKHANDQFYFPQGLEMTVSPDQPKSVIMDTCLCDFPSRDVDAFGLFNCVVLEKGQNSRRNSSKPLTSVM